ncbi:hypothetical protein DPMN_021532 [Dreissena polymorpha]|uniref:C2H2-type domain-containing protein n=1 Tax=Dreissena polymorpha TaxID=45954 RepID=A0A9D4S983_DREPO|nr:hypothetical protein DPMN_021532 [Dreissena polymorpha]
MHGCTFCSKAFPSDEELVHHIRIHAIPVHRVVKKDKSQRIHTIPVHRVVKKDKSHRIHTIPVHRVVKKD